LIYTSIGHPTPEQWLAVPQDDDLLAWDRPSVNPVLTAEAHRTLNVREWRDPFLFREAGAMYMVCGGSVDGRGSVELYKASNAELTRWEFVGIVFKYPDRTINDIECPNLFRIGEKWVLLISPNQPCEYFIGELDLTKPRFIVESHGILDAGSSYASNISVDDSGRTILWLWGRTPQGKGWNGCMTLPRILSIGGDGVLRQQPPLEFETLRGTPLTLPDFDLAPGPPVMLNGPTGDSFELSADVILGNAAEAGFDIRCASDGKPGLAIRIGRGTLAVGNIRTPITRGLNRCRLRVFADKRVVEVYVNDGEAALYTTVNAGADDQRIAAVAQAGAAPPGRGGGRRGGAAGNPRIENLKFWPMKPASFSLEHFHL
jgi:beta-fructofuranosidase